MDQPAQSPGDNTIVNVMAIMKVNLKKKRGLTVKQLSYQLLRFCSMHQRHVVQIMEAV